MVPHHYTSATRRSGCSPCVRGWSPLGLHIHRASEAYPLIPASNIRRLLFRKEIITMCKYFDCRKIQRTFQWCIPNNRFSIGIRECLSVLFIRVLFYISSANLLKRWKSIHLHYIIYSMTRSSPHGWACPSGRQGVVPWFRPKFGSKKRNFAPVF